MKPILKSAKLLMLVLTLCSPFVASAGGYDDDDDGGGYGGGWGGWGGGWGGNHGGGTNVPLDGGLSLLFVAGVGYGVKRYAQARKKKSEEAGNETQEQ